MAPTTRRSRPSYRPVCSMKSRPERTVRTTSIRRVGSPASRNSDGTRINLRPWDFHLLMTPATPWAIPVRPLSSNRPCWMGWRPSTTRIRATSTPTSSASPARFVASRWPGAARSHRSRRPCTPVSTASTPPRSSPPTWRRCRTPTARGTGIRSGRADGGRRRCSNNGVRPFGSARGRHPHRRQLSADNRSLPAIGSSRCSCLTEGSRVARRDENTEIEGEALNAMAFSTPRFRGRV